jgi:hypothetical protein
VQLVESGNGMWVLSLCINNCYSWVLNSVLPHITSCYKKTDCSTPEPILFGISNTTHLLLFSRLLCARFVMAVRVCRRTLSSPGDRM